MNQPGNRVVVITGAASGIGYATAELFRDLRLIAITDSLRDGPRGLALRAAAAAFGGATMIQLRLKEESARSLVEIARHMNAPASFAAAPYKERTVDRHCR